MSTTVRLNGTVQFTSFLVMRMNINIVTNCDSLIVIFALNKLRICQINFDFITCHRRDKELSAADILKNTIE